MAQDKPIFEYHEESQGERLARKTKESPFMVVGELNFIIILYLLLFFTSRILILEYL